MCPHKIGQCFGNSHTASGGGIEQASHAGGFLAVVACLQPFRDPTGVGLVGKTPFDLVAPPQLVQESGGETPRLPGFMVAGNQARMPKGLLKGIRTLTSNIVTEMGYAADLHREALIATGVVLFVFILLINMLFSVLKRKEHA